MYVVLSTYHQDLIQAIAIPVHWDTPLSIQAYYGGFLSPRVVDDFVK